MKALLIDAGNSRLKWATMRNDTLGAVRSLAWDDRSLPRVAARIAASARGAKRVMVSCVAGSLVKKALRDALRTAGLPAPQFVTSLRRQGGVSNAYRSPGQLGVDRWLLLIAAQNIYPQENVCILSAGTALTIDLLDRRGKHRGGIIIPGPALMVESLLSATAEIRRRAARLPEPPRSRAVPPFFARDTRSAIQAGSRYAAAAFAAYGLEHARDTVGLPLRVVLTGGGAGELERLLPRPRAGLKVRRIDHLVLRGLAVLARHQSG
jgi:type III pantothenate kinase